MLVGELQAALGRPRRRPARDRLCARRRARRQLHVGAAGVRRARLPHECISFKALAEAVAPLMERRRQPRGRWTSTRSSPGRSTTGWAWPRRRSNRSRATWPGTSASAGIRANPISAGPARDAGRAGHPGVRRPLLHVGKAGSVELAPRRPGPRRGRRALPALGPLARDHRRDPACGRRLPRHGRPLEALSSPACCSPSTSATPRPTWACSRKTSSSTTGASRPHALRLPTISPRCWPDCSLLQDLRLADAHATIVSSVVPTLAREYEQVIERYFEGRGALVGPDLKTGRPIRIDRPQELGADRLVNAIAAFECVGGACIAVDFGTAINYDVVSLDGGVPRRRDLTRDRDLARGLLAPRAFPLPRVDIEATAPRHRQGDAGGHPGGSRLRLRGPGGRDRRAPARGAR